MNYTWEKDDIYGDNSLLGGVVTNNNKSENYIIGYRVAKENLYYLVSLEDGMIFGENHLVKFIEYLNDNGFIPVMNITRYRLKSS